MSRFFTWPSSCASTPQLLVRQQAEDSCVTATDDAAIPAVENALGDSVGSMSHSSADGQALLGGQPLHRLEGRRHLLAAHLLRAYILSAILSEKK